MATPRSADQAAAVLSRQRRTEKHGSTEDLRRQLYVACLDMRIVRKLTRLRARRLLLAFGFALVNKRCQGGSAQRERDAGMPFQAVIGRALVLGCGMRPGMRRRSLCPARSLMVGRTSRCSHVSGDAGRFLLIGHAANSASRLKYLRNVCAQPAAADLRLAAVAKATAV